MQYKCLYIYSHNIQYIVNIQYTVYVYIYIYIHVYSMHCILLEKWRLKKDKDFW